MLNVDQSQRRDIDTTLDDRLTLVIDEENIADNPYIFEPTSFVGNNWFKQGNNIVKLNLAEQDSLIFLSSPLTKLLQKDITNVIVSFDYNISNVSVNYPILSNISLTCMEMTNYMLVENILTTQGHIDIDCSLFNFSNNVVNTSISEQGFKVGINFNGNKSNATIKLSNVQIQFKYQNKLATQEDSVVNRLEPHIDFYRDEDGDLVLQIGGDASGKGIDHSSGDIDTYSKTEIDNKLATKVNVEIGKGLSSNDYTLTEKTKLGTVETNANFYVHPSSHQTGMITESSALTNLETSENATQHEINLAIDSKINSGGGGGGSVDIATSWGAPTSDSKVPSEKLAKDTLDGKANVSHTHTSNQVTDLINTIYPIGSIYMSVNSTSPQILFGGTWEQIKDTFLLASGDTYASDGDVATAQHGSATVSLTEEQMPRHTHTQNAHTHTIGSLARYTITGKGVAAVGDGYGNSNNYKTGSTTATNKYTGGTNTTEEAQNGSAHENMPPYMAVYCWKRTA